jgi:putative transposase
LTRPDDLVGNLFWSRNQYYNKQREHHQKHLAKQQRFTSRKLDQVTTKRNRRVQHYLHTASRRIIDLLVEEGIGTLCIGKNPLGKQEVEMGKKNNQHFVQMPHAEVNGSYNIGRKVAPTPFGLGVGGAAVCPRRLAV